MSESVPIDEVDMERLDPPSEKPDPWTANYRALRTYGFSAMKATEIILEAERGDQDAKYYLARARGEKPALDPSDPTIRAMAEYVMFGRRYT